MAYNINGAYTGPIINDIPLFFVIQYAIQNNKSAVLGALRKLGYVIPERLSDRDTAAKIRNMIVTARNMSGNDDDIYRKIFTAMDGFRILPGGSADQREAARNLVTSREALEGTAYMF